MTKNDHISIERCGGRSKCPLVNTLDIIGDKWTLIIIRDMIFVGKKQFGDFLESPEGISTNILTDRLKRLEKYGVIEKKLYSKNPKRYEYFLKDIGYDLKPVLLEIARWGKENIEGTLIPTEEEFAAMREKYSRKE